MRRASLVPGTEVRGRELCACAQRAEGTGSGEGLGRNPLPPLPPAGPTGTRVYPGDLQDPIETHWDSGDL